MSKSRVSRRMTEWLFAPVEPDQLSVALQLFAEMQPEDRREYDARTIELIEHFHKPENEPKNGDVGGLISAIQFRLEALASLRDRPEMAAWTLPSGEKGCDFVNGALIAAAATEPVVTVGKNRVTFNPDSFFKRALSISDIDGEA